MNQQGALFSMLTGCWKQPLKINAWLYQLLFIKNWFSWWWAASLLGTC